MPLTRVSGKLGVYNVGTVADIDAHLARLATRWSVLCEDTAPTRLIRTIYHTDIDLLLDARNELTNGVGGDGRPAAP